MVGRVTNRCALIMRLFLYQYTHLKLHMTNSVLSTDNVDYSQWTEKDLELKNFKCPRCLLVFPTSSDLFAHMRATYEDPTTCQTCDKDLRSMANLLSHSYTHTGLRPYKCPKCQYATRTRFNLRVHFGSCADLEQFSYKRGHFKNLFKDKRRKRKLNSETAINRKSKIRRLNSRTAETTDDALHQLTKTDPFGASSDVSCLVRVHIQYFPRQCSGTEKFYSSSTHQKQQPKPQPEPPVTDVSQFYQNQSTVQW